MTSEQTVAAVRAALAEGFHLLDRFFLAPKEVLTFRPAYPEAWTMAEHLEHVSLVNHFLLLTIGKGCRTATKRAKLHQPPEGESDLDRLSPIAVPGAFDWPPPKHMLPRGRADLGEIRELLGRQHAHCDDLLDAMPNGEGRLYSIRMSVNNLGRLDLYQWLYFLAQHMRYHETFCSELFTPCSPCCPEQRRSAGDIAAPPRGT